MFCELHRNKITPAKTCIQMRVSVLWLVEKGHTYIYYVTVRWKERRQLSALARIVCVSIPGWLRHLRKLVAGASPVPPSTALDRRVHVRQLFWCAPFAWPSRFLHPIMCSEIIKKTPCAPARKKQVVAGSEGEEQEIDFLVISRAETVGSDEKWRCKSWCPQRIYTQSLSLKYFLSFYRYDVEIWASL